MSLSSILRESAYVATVTSTDNRGNPVYGAPVLRKVRIERSQRMVTTARGEESPSSHRLWCLDPISLTDRIWLPGSSTSSSEASLTPLAVSAVSDFAGARTLYRVDL